MADYNKSAVPKTAIQNTGSDIFTSEAFKLALTKGFLEVFKREFDIVEQGLQFVREDTQRRETETVQSYRQIGGSVPMNRDADEIPYVTTSDGFSYTRQTYNYRRGIAIERTLMEVDDVGVIRGRQADLARNAAITREQAIAYAKERNIPVPITVSSPYSIDECLWGKAIECGSLEDPWQDPPEDAFTMTVSPDKAPDKPQYIEIRFEKGVPISIDGEEMDGVTLVTRMNEIAGKHGIGRIDHIEDRVVGIKSREIYEAPAATVLLQAHLALEAMTMSKGQLDFKQKVAKEMSDLIYGGLWFSQLNRDLSAYVLSSQRYVTGEVRLKLYKGHSTVVGRKAPKSLYNLSLATYDVGDKFDQSASAGFIHLWGLPLKNQAQVQLLGDSEGPLSIMGPEEE